jgi:DMSO reductase anchor subunit
MTEARSYHGQPVLKQPVWTWEIPLYFFTGGAAGASAGLAYLSDLRGNEELGRRAWAVALAAVGVSPALLISDLGRPARFFNMLRMFKVTSPMSVGTWVLSASATTTAVAAANAWTGRLQGPSKVARPTAALLGLPLSTYTAALIANTSVPVWHEARTLLPFVFGSGAALTAGGAAVAVTAPRHARPARRLALAGAAVEVACNELMRHRLGEVGNPYHHGLSRAIGYASSACVAGGAALLAARGQASRRAAAISGTLLCAGALATRLDIFKAGFESASDPAYVVAPQRAAIERGERPGGARRRSRAQAPDAAAEVR